MSQIIELNRREFLKNAGVAALVGTAGTGTFTAAEKAQAAQGPAGSEYDFDEVYSRIGTDCTKWDRQITGGEGHMRMNLATSRKLIELALDNMGSALQKV